MIRITGIFLLALLASCSSAPSPKKEDVTAAKVVSLSNGITEIICAAGLQERLVGVDVTSIWPAEANALPKVGHVREIKPEGIISLGADLVMGLKDEVKPELVKQLESAGIEVALYDLDFTLDGSNNLIKNVCDKLGATEQAGTLIAENNSALGQISPLNPVPKVLFIYARGAGTLLIGGEDTKADGMIRMAGAQNAVSGFKDHKPLTAEAVIAANPDAILILKVGDQSKIEETLAIPGVAHTNAAKNKAVIEFDGQQLTAFGPRTGAAVKELNSRLLQILENSNSASK